MITTAAQAGAMTTGLAWAGTAAIAVTSPRAATNDIIFLKIILLILFTIYIVYSGFN